MRSNSNTQLAEPLVPINLATESVESSFFRTNKKRTGKISVFPARNFEYDLPLSRRERHALA